MSDIDKPIGLQEARRLCTEVGPEMSKYVDKYVTAVLGLKTEHYGHLLGTGNLISVGASTFLVTALHVINSDINGIAFTRADNEPPIEIEGTCFALKHPYDVVAVRIDLEKRDGENLLKRKEALPVSHLDPSVCISSDLYFILGYTDKGSRFSALYRGVISKSSPLTTTLGIPSAQSGEFCHPFRVFPATDSGLNLPPIPFQTCHLDFSGFQF